MKNNPFIGTGVALITPFNEDYSVDYKSLENIVGKSIVEFAAKTLGLANACDSESLATLNSGGRLKGIISSESSVIRIW